MSTIAVQVQNVLSPHQETIERLGWTLVHFAWQAAAVALLLAVTLYLLRQASPNVRYIASCAALALTVALPVATMPLVEVSRPVAEAGLSLPPPVVTEAVPMQTIELMESFDAPPAEMTVPVARVPWKESRRAGIARLEPALPYLVLGWLAGVLGLSAWHLGGWAQLQRMTRRKVRQVAAPLQTTLTELAGRLGVRRAVILLESALVEVPTVVGWLRPVILLPASALTGLTLEQLEAILAHELAHVRRYDYLVNLVQTIVEILGFYHPAVWWISHQIRDERENCCDDLAVRVCGDSVRYAKALTHLEEMRHRNTELAIAATGGSLIGRIGRLLGQPTSTRSRFAWLPGLVALLLAAAIIVPLVFSVPASAARETPGGVTTNDTEPNSADAIEEPQVRLEFIFAEVFADRVLDSDTAAKLAGLFYRRQAIATSPMGLTQYRISTVAPSELTRPLGEVFAAWDITPGKAQAVLEILAEQGYAEVVAGPALLVDDRESATLQRTDASGPSLTITPRVNSSLGDSVGIEATFDGEQAAGPSAWESLIAAPANGGYTLLRPGNPPSRIDEQGRTRMPLWLVRPTIMNPPQAEAQAIQDGSARITAEVRGMPPGQRQPAGKVRLEFIIADLYANKVLDEDTAARISETLYEGRASRGGEGTRPRPESLRRPLGRLFFRPNYRVDEPQTLLELLESGGYASVHEGPAVVAGANQPVVILMEELGGPDDPNGQVRLRLSTAAVFDPRDPNFVALQVISDASDFLGAGPMPLAFTRTAAGEYALLPPVQYAQEHTDRDGNARQLLVFVRPTLIDQTEDSRSAEGNPGTPPTRGSLRGMAPTRMLTPAQPLSNGPQQDATQVLVEIVMARAQAQATLDRQTKESVAALLPREVAEAAASPQVVTLGQLLNRCVSQTSLTPGTADALVRLLEARGYLKTESRPQLLARNNQQAVLQVGTDAYIPDGADPTSPPRHVEVGTVLRVTPHMPDPFEDRLRLEIGIDWSRLAPPLAPPSQSDGPPTVSKTEVASTVTVENALAWPIFVEPGEDAPDEGGLLLILTPHVLPRRPPEAAVRGGPRREFGPQRAGSDAEEAPREVLLRVRTAVMQAGEPPRTQDATRRIVARDGETVRFVALADKPFPLDSLAVADTADDQRPDSGVVLAITPHLGPDGVACDIVANVNYLMPPLAGSNRPTPRRRTIENSCTVQYGGTISAIGLTDDPAEYEGEPRREVAVFITAERIADGNVPAPTAPTAPPRRQWNYHMPVDDMSPLEFLSRLKDANAAVVEVSGIPTEWVKAEHLPALFELLDSQESCPHVGGFPVSPFMASPNTIGREAGLLIQSFWGAHYPILLGPGLSETEKEELRARWGRHREEHRPVNSSESNATSTAEMPPPISANMVTIGLETGVQDADCYLDLDSGRVYRNPPEVQNESDRIAWRADQGIDLWCDIRNISLNVVLIPQGLTLAKVPAVSPEDLDIVEARRLLQEGPQAGRFLTDSPDIWVFQTSQGTVGVLQVLRMDSIMAGSAPAMRPKAVLAYRILSEQTTTSTDEGVRNETDRFREEKVADSPSADRWSEPVDGLAGRVVLARSHVTNGTAIISTRLDLHNVATPGRSLTVPAERKLSFRVVDSDGTELPRAQGAYDGWIPIPKDISLPAGGGFSEDVTREGFGIQSDRLAVLDLGSRDNWIIPRDGREYFLQVTLDMPETTDGAWHGTIALPPARFPLRPEAMDPAVLGPRIEELGRAMIAAPHKTVGAEAERALSLIDDERVIPWYVAAVRLLESTNADSPPDTGSPTTRDAWAWTQIR